MSILITKEMKDYEDYLILKNYSSATRVMYLRTLKSYLRFHIGKFPNQNLTQDTAREYILYRTKSGKSWPTINCDYSSLRKYFREVLQGEWTLKKVPRPRAEFSLPSTLSTQDIVKLINHASSYKHQVFITFVYSTGLRLSEAIHIKFEDIDRNRLQIRVQRGKGAKDRYIQIPEALIEILTDYYLRCKPKIYLFNGYKEGYPYATTSAQWTLRQSRKNCNFTKQASIHTLRHAYATHHLESGTDLVFLKHQLGHKHLKTTERYLHICVDRKRKIVHPISTLKDHLVWIDQ